MMFWMENLWREFSWRESLVHPAALGFVLELPQLLSVLQLGENDAVMESVGLTLPEFNQVRLDHVAAPERSQDIWKVMRKEKKLDRADILSCR